jgi:uncharacterized membrane protein required for colicin V production
MTLSCGKDIIPRRGLPRRRSPSGQAPLHRGESGMDVILVGFIGGFIFGGWRTGFLRRVLGLVFLAISFLAGAYFRVPVGAAAAAFFPSIPQDYANLVGYTIVFPVVLATLHIVSAKVIGDVRLQGISKELDQGLGAVFGGLEAVLILSAVVVILDTYFGTSSHLPQAGDYAYLKSLTQALNSTTTVGLLRGSTVPVVLAVLGPVLPTDLRSLLPGGLPTGLPGLPGGVPLPTP